MQQVDIGDKYINVIARGNHRYIQQAEFGIVEWRTVNSTGRSIPIGTAKKAGEENSTPAMKF